MLKDITGFDGISLQPNAGAQGEFAGLLAIKKYHDLIMKVIEIFVLFLVALMELIQLVHKCVVWKYQLLNVIILEILI